jgi:LPXTG-site transpeptidase (sortase) family protein
MTRRFFFHLWPASWLVMVLLLTVTTLPTHAATTELTNASGSPLFFKETGHTLAYNFRTFWQLKGGLAIFGFPISEVFLENGVPTQYFERARLEWHADRALVEGGLLGRWALPDDPTQPALQPVGGTDNPALLFFPQTGHTLGGGFKDFWLNRGGLPVFGYPLSEEFQENNPQDGQSYTVQYFERARFEYHPDLPVEFQVELGQLGRQFLAQNPPPATALVPAKDATTAWAGLVPVRVQVPRIKVEADITEGGFAFNSWEVPRYSAVHYWPVSGYPGGKGNIILAAHASFRDYLFFDLPKIALDDEIILTVAASGQPQGQPRERHYKVIQILTVKPQDTWVMLPSDIELLTLITCVPYGVYSDRLIVRAVPLTPAGS